MAVTMSPKQKVYQGVLQEIRNYIELENLRPGDKLPSERELSEKLAAGRSSVREALRAMELIGLIETRHGEGTFLSKYRPYQTVELLSSFVLKENTTRLELLTVKKLLEKEAVKLAYAHIDAKKLEKLEQNLTIPSVSMKDQHFAFFSTIFECTENLLFARIWGLINDYAHKVGGHYSREFYQKLILAYKNQHYASIEQLFSEEKMIETL
ncbi:FadR/GntR family transcriptional regulator [Ornithinibacillus contaminans]|uniref:FadR/GntR family transcriptional regulator n=1 Tax=Ornithinibacillus contaminans TaxID=694055 RepID=UPI000A53DFC0|nr:GntR family transcriptional regulator [Ornithinibacillus contaminans]